VESFGHIDCHEMLMLAMVNVLFFNDGRLF